MRTSRGGFAPTSINDAGMERASRGCDDETDALDRSVTALHAGELALALLAAAPCRAQDLEPRAYAASPEGAFFVVAGLSRSTGGVLTDPTLPVQNVDATIDVVPLAAGYTFGLFGRLALVTAAIPVSHAEVSGEVGEETRSITRTGFVDMRTKFSINLTGNPAMGARAFVVSPRKVIVGTSVTVVAPTGQYKGTQLINLGTHRWAFKPELGRQRTEGTLGLRRLCGGMAVYRQRRLLSRGATADAGPGRRPSGPHELHVPPRLWVAVDATWYHGGSARVGGWRPDSGDEQLSSRRDALAAAREIAVDQAVVQLGPRGSHRYQLQDAECRMAVADAHESQPQGRRRALLRAALPAGSRVSIHMAGRLCAGGPHRFEPVRRLAKKKPVDQPHIRMPVSASTPPTSRQSAGSTTSPYPVVV